LREPSNAGTCMMKFEEQSRRTRSYLEQHMPHYLAVLEQMVGVNSFTANAVGVNELGRQTAELFANIGFRAETQSSVNPLYGNHLIMTRPGRITAGRAAPTIGLVSHLDTVFPADEEQRNDFRWRIEGERIYGPGTVDIKGGTVMIYMVLSALRAIAPQAFEAINWLVLLDASEEAGGRDFGRLCVERLGDEALACLVFEPGNWSGDRPHLVVARKGMAIYRIEVEGKAAHAGSAHDQGANAIVQMADVIERICHLTDYTRALTFNVGTVAGGTVINRVPHFASASVEMRAFNQDTFDEGVAAVLALNELSTVHTSDGTFGCRVRTEVINRVLPWPRNVSTDRLFRHWQATAAELGSEVIAEERAGLSDGNYFWQEVPTIDGLGPAGGNAHCSERAPDGSKDQEYVLATSFVPKAVLNTMAILRLIEEKETASNATT
jgi:glutamate carboxypeptidase